ncbi:hypothetical protein [Pseudoduganella chitinolytica]|uniref:DUF2568 domain-containing protein n=1 Tax=Pseudoduganella chitinolytica TaxID=34070 RepID=A0ABY8BBD7_9BURK|nr:hypothetical protein [Pseudoduganella chitinolytica]WEF31659.1 hypothetical protein PX653_19675 [Pseudoduganella chitinolytica]
MKPRTRNRLALYGAELLLVVALGGALAAWPGTKPLELSIGAVLLHLTTSIGMLPAQWRFDAAGPSDRLFGLRMERLLQAMIVIGVLLMLSWVVVASTAAWVAGLVMVLLALEELVTQRGHAV